MRKKCLSCGVQFTLSGSGRRQKCCPKCATRVTGRGRVSRASNPLKTKGAGNTFSAPIPPAEMGRFIREQIEAQKDQPNPISFATPEGRKGRVWLASDAKGKRLIGDDRHWRVHVSGAIKFAKRERRISEPRKATVEVIRIEGSSHIPLTRLKPNPPARDPACVGPDIWPRPRGYKVRLYIEAEKELQQLGCGWRNVIVEFDGKRVHLSHNARTATMQRDAFKAILARNKRRKRPQLKLAVSNPPKLDERFSDAA